MTKSNVLLPLRVPELGPSLGRLLAVKSGGEAILGLDSVRFKLGTRIIEGGGEARRLAANGERSAAVAAIGRESWKQAWDEAVGSTADLLVGFAEIHFEAEARAVGMGRRLRLRLRYTPSQKRALMARLGSVGANLIPVLDELEEYSERAVEATGLEPEVIPAWQEALRLAANRLETAWMAMERLLQDEVTRVRETADRIARWRKPIWPVLAAGAVTIPVVLWFGLVLGGYVASPNWLSTIWQMVFGG